MIVYSYSDLRIIKIQSLRVLRYVAHHAAIAVKQDTSVLLSLRHLFPRHLKTLINDFMTTTVLLPKIKGPNEYRR